MKHTIVLVIPLILPLALLGDGLRIAAPSTADCADTESAAVVAFTSGGLDDRFFKLTLELDASVSNSVTLAFGSDSNANGVLEREEVDALIGWDSGTWFYQNRRSGEEVHTSRSNGHRRLDWVLGLSPRKTAKSLSATDADGDVFTNAVPPTLFDSNWNLLQVTTRGLTAPNGIATMEVNGWGFKIILR